MLLLCFFTAFEVDAWQVGVKHNGNDVWYPVTLVNGVYQAGPLVISYNDECWIENDGTYYKRPDNYGGLAADASAYGYFKQNGSDNVTITAAAGTYMFEFSYSNDNPYNIYLKTTTPDYTKYRVGLKSKFEGFTDWGWKQYNGVNSNGVITFKQKTGSETGLNIQYNTTQFDVNDSCNGLVNTQSESVADGVEKLFGTNNYITGFETNTEYEFQIDFKNQKYKITKVATQQQVSTPVISDAEGNKVTVTCGTDGADIYYTTNGSTPTTSSTKYSGPFDITANCTVKAIAVKDGMTNSEVASKNVTYTAPASNTVTFYVKDDGNWGDVRVWAWDVKTSNTPIFSVTNNEYSNRPYITNFDSNVVKSGYTFTVEKGHVGEDVVWKITTTDNVSVKISGKSDSPAAGDIASSTYNGKVLVTASNSADFSSFTASTWQAGEPEVDSYKDYKVQLKYAGNSWNYNDAGSISNGVWTISNLDLGDNGGFNLQISTNNGSNYTEYGIGSNKSNSKISNNQASQLSTGNNYVYATENAVVNLSLDLATMKLTATWTEEVVEKNKLYITGNVDVGSGKEDKWGQQVATLTEVSDGVYSCVVDKLIGEWIIYDGVNHANWNFARGDESDKLAIGKESKVWFRSGKNFNTSFDKKVRVTFTLVKGSAQANSSIYSKVKIEDVSEKDYVYFVNKNTGWSTPHIYTYTNAYKDSNGNKHEMVHNASFPGEALSEKADDVKEALGETCDVYKYEVDIDEYEQVVFAQSGGNQTRNYHLVSGGIYYPDADLLPDNYWYTDQQIKDYALQDNDHLDVYPNDNVFTEYNNIYVYDEDLFKYLLEGEVENGVFKPTLDGDGELQLKENANICIDIKDGDKVYTGDETTTTLVPVMIGGKVFLRLALADDILASGAGDMQIFVYTKEKENNNWKDSFTVTDKVYADGKVYYRPPQTAADLKDLITPTRVYIKHNNEEVELTEGLNSSNKTVYRLNNLSNNYNFTVWAEFDGIEEPVQYGHEKSIENELALKSGIRKESSYEHVGSYKINGTDGFSYNLTILWEDEELYVTTVPKGSGLKLQTDAKFHVFNAQEDEEIQISHIEAFGGNGDNEGHYAEVNHGFVAHKNLNTHVDFKSRFSTKFEPISGDANVSKLTVNSPVAGVFAVKLSHDVIVNDDLSFAKTEMSVPVRVIPTVESVGLYIQGQPVAAITNGSATGYAVYIPEEEMDDEWHYKGHEGYDQSIVTWDPEKRVKIQCIDEDAAQTENNSNQSAAVIYIKKEGASAQAAHYAPSVLKVASATALDVTSDEYASQREGYTPYSITNTFTKNDNNASFYIEQNGVASEPASLTIAKSPEEFSTLTGQSSIPVGVETIESSDEDVEAVYYNLNGVRVNAEALTPGLYIVVKGNHSEKILVK